MRRLWGGGPETDPTINELDTSLIRAYQLARSRKWQEGIINITQAQKDQLPETTQILVGDLERVGIVQVRP